MFNSNPAFSDRRLDELQNFDATESMTVQGTAAKTLFLLLCAVVPFVAIWTQLAQGFVDKVNMYAMGGLIVGAILSFIIIFNPKTAKFLSPVYAFFEGLILGAVSAMFEMQFKGIVFQAVALTFLCMLSMLFLYASRLIQNTPKFRKVMVISLISIMSIYLINFVGQFFGFTIPMIYSSGAVGIGFSVFVVIIASLTFITDFDNIENAVVAQAPKSAEWYYAFGLMLGLVWLYIEVLNLLAKLNRR